MTEEGIAALSRAPLALPLLLCVFTGYQLLVLIDRLPATPAGLLTYLKWVTHDGLLRLPMTDTPSHTNPGPFFPQCMDFSQATYEKHMGITQHLQNKSHIYHIDSTYKPLPKNWHPYMDPQLRPRVIKPPANYKKEEDPNIAAKKKEEDPNIAAKFSPSAFEYDSEDDDEAPALTCGYESSDDEEEEEEKKQEPFKGYRSASMPWKTAVALAKSLGGREQAATVSY